MVIKTYIAMAKYRLTFKKNPQKKDGSGAWHANPVVVNRLTTRSVCKTVTRNTTIAPTELESSFNLVCDGVPEALQQGNSVTLGRLGTLRLSFGSKGVDDVKDFDAATMVSNIKVIFTPSKELLAAVKNGLTFENMGVVEDGFIYPSVKAYQEYKVSGRVPVEGGTTTPGGGSGGTTEGGGTEGGGSGSDEGGDSSMD